MITVECELGSGCRARAFFRELFDAAPVLALTEERYWDDDDQLREPVLREIVTRPNVSALAYPTLGHRDVLQVFLRDGSELVFACVMVTGVRLREMLAQASPVVEGFSLQVLPGEHLSVEGMRAALQSWIERCFPGIVLPSLALELWTGPDGILYELLELLVQSRRARVALSVPAVPDELQPDPGLADPPYGRAA